MVLRECDPSPKPTLNPAPGAQVESVISEHKARSSACTLLAGPPDTAHPDRGSPVHPHPGVPLARTQRRPAGSQTPPVLLQLDKGRTTAHQPVRGSRAGPAQPDGTGPGAAPPPQPEGGQGRAGGQLLPGESPCHVATSPGWSEHVGTREGPDSSQGRQELGQAWKSSQPRRAIWQLLKKLTTEFP